MKTKLLLAITFVLMVAVIGAGTATATPPSGLTSELLARGAAGDFSVKSENFDFTIKAKMPPTSPWSGQRSPRTASPVGICIRDLRLWLSSRGH
jgi:hypothetical protein